jgi:phosphohistidine phosphatase
MTLYLVRHGDPETEPRPDEERVLSQRGIAVTRAMAHLLKHSRFDPPEIIVTSPFIRAKQTARILLEEFAPDARLEVRDGLRPSFEIERPMSLIASKSEGCNSLMLVGHNPLFSVLASVLVSGSDIPAIEMTKSAVAIYELTRFDVPGMRGVLRAYLPPAIV